MAGFRFALKLTPHGRLALTESGDAPELAPELARRLQEAFSRGAGSGLLQLGARELVETLPAAWRSARPPRPRVTATVGGRPPGGLGTDALLDFAVEVILDGERLTQAEINELLKQTDGLALIRGRWVEVDPKKLAQTVEQFRKFEQIAAKRGITFAEAMRMMAGADVAGDSPAAADPEWAGAVAGPWLAETLRVLREPEAGDRLDPGRDLNGTLRPYQEVGVRWLVRNPRSAATGHVEPERIA